MSTPKKVAKDYLPPAFTDPYRTDRIQEKEHEIEAILMSHWENMQIPGASFGLVIDDRLFLSFSQGRINLQEKRPASSHSCFRIASMTKSFTAMAILKLRDEGKLALFDPVAKYIPEMDQLPYLTDDAPVMTIHNLLTMTSGLPEDDAWGDRQLDQPDEMLSQLMMQGPSFSTIPSFQYEYSNTGYALLGMVIKAVSGKPYQSYINENILQPLGMDDTYWEYDRIPGQQLVQGYRQEDKRWIPEPMLHDGSYGAMGGIITTIEDFSKYVSFHLAAWPPRNGPQSGPVARSTVREMHTACISWLDTNTTDHQGNPVTEISGYGYGLVVTQNDKNLRWVSHGGGLPGFGSRVVFYPNYGIGLIAFGNLTYTNPLPYRELAHLLFEDETLKPRTLPASEILQQRKSQVELFIQDLQGNAEEDFLADNFYLDKSRSQRMQDYMDIWKEAGAVFEVGEIQAQNQLRGTFSIKAEHGKVEVFFSLTPEAVPKVQQLKVTFHEDCTD